MAAARTWDLEADVAVVGSGGAGLTAAILAADHGAQVVILERSGKVGGTTAVSGGVIWIPVNHHMQEAGLQDSREEALAYCKRLASGRAPDELVEAFVDTGHQMVRYLEEHTPLKFTIWGTPDDYFQIEGGKLCGRSLEPVLFCKKELGEREDKLRPAPMFMIPLNLQETITDYKLLESPENAPTELIMERMEKGMVACGPALVGWLLKACLDRGTTVLLETRARRLVREGERVVGLSAERDGREFLIRARRGVVLASGGFEWNEELKAKFLPAPLTHPQSPPFNEGDGLIMAMEVGADLANMSEAWWIPSGAVPGEEYEGRQLSRFIAPLGGAPHSILVNRFGQRFTNEGSPTHKGMGWSLHYFDGEPATYDYRNLPCWAIFDGQYREKYPVLTLMATDPDPDWLARDESLEGLALKVGIDPQGLRAAVERWNGFVREGKDLDFGRGSGAMELQVGDSQGPNPSLDTIEKPPFYALPIYDGALGTSGGPQTNTRGQVLNVWGKAIPGLYAAGNVAASPTGAGYYGNGGTIGPAMTWGYICGINAAGEPGEAP